MDDDDGAMIPEASRQGARSLDAAEGPTAAGDDNDRQDIAIANLQITHAKLDCFVGHEVVMRDLPETVKEHQREFKTIMSTYAKERTGEAHDQ